MRAVPDTGNRREGAGQEGARVAAGAVGRALQGGDKGAAGKGGGAREKAGAGACRLGAGGKPEGKLGNDTGTERG